MRNEATKMNTRDVCLSYLSSGMVFALCIHSQVSQTWCIANLVMSYVTTLAAVKDYSGIIQLTNTRGCFVVSLSYTLNHRDTYTYHLLIRHCSHG